jgi:hypothetical protein
MYNQLMEGIENMEKLKKGEAEAIFTKTFQ